MFEKIHIFSGKKNIYKPTVFSQNLVEHLEQFFGTAHLAPLEITRRIDEPVLSAPSLASAQDSNRSTQMKYQRPGACPSKTLKRYQAVPSPNARELRRLSSRLQWCKPDQSDFVVFDHSLMDAHPCDLRFGAKDRCALLLQHEVSAAADIEAFWALAQNCDVMPDLGIIVNFGNSAHRAAEIYASLENQRVDRRKIATKFIGFAPALRRGSKFRSLATMSLQNITFELLNLKYNANPHTVPKELFASSLH
jgi:hypothetical protein